MGKPYLIVKNELFGRYLVASRDIKQGEIIFSEKPILIGSPGYLLCFKCCKSIESSFNYCNNCNTAIICKNNCSGQLHTEQECDIFKSEKINAQYFLEYPQIIFPLRCLILKKNDPQIWNEFIEMKSHSENKPKIMEILKNMNILDINDEILQKTCGILDINTFELRLPQSKVKYLRGLFINAALMVHDCIGNTFLTIDDDFILTVKASVNINKDSPILFNYSNILQGNIDRKQYLKQKKHFDCTCKRCNDPSELKTDISTLKCHKCLKGFVKIKETNDEKSDWECDNCGKIFVHSLVNIIIEEGRDLIHKIGKTNINDIETLHKKMLKTFHPNHFLLLEIEQNLIQLYSHFPTNIKNLEKKIIIYKKLLQIFIKIEPGISKITAMTLYQMQSTMIELSRKKYQEKLITQYNLFIDLQAAEKILNEALKFLLHEPTKSPEGKIARAALIELKKLRTSIGDVHEEILNEDNKQNNKKK